VRTVSREDILAGIVAVAREHLAFAGPIRAEMRLIDDLRLDSLRLLTLAVEVENRFRVRLDPDEEASIATVGDLIDTVARKLARTTDGEGEPS
jgi:acyl carrier protein